MLCIAQQECPQRDSNPRYHLERVATWTASRWGRPRLGYPPRPGHELAAAFRADALELARAARAEGALEAADPGVAGVCERDAAALAHGSHLQRHRGDCSRMRW